MRSSAQLARLHGANNIFFEAHPTLWHPLEVVLSNWVDLVAACVAAWERLCAAVEARGISPVPPPNRASANPPDPQSLLLPAALDAAVAELFQHGYKPFGGDYYRPQRLERLLDHWRRLVTDGVWAVGPQGVEGHLDTFREADSVRWRDYLIPPTW
ncbi:hypothetical protein F4824DRAFT_502829 [Ustulina deusta]|nr:hypothetical protein F4824DRAFT_502829 [Ustulina deusta]